MTTVAGNRGGAGYLYEEGELYPAQEDGAGRVIVDREYLGGESDRCFPECPNLGRGSCCKTWPAQESDNPKNVAARRRVKLALLPSAGVIHGSLACMLGAEKYGAYNWREKKIALMEYASAIMRHTLKWVDGEDCEEGCHHLGNIIACASIMLDAIENEIAIDDRPSPGKAAELLKQLSD